MDLRLNALTSMSAANATAVRAGAGKAVGGAASSANVQSSFGEAFKTALDKVSAAQNEAGNLQTQVQLGNPNVSLEETMLSMQKAQIGFTAALHVRNRMMQAYTDVMNMQV
jgi:flagellar hook-basal body complex protein FliE